MKQCVCVVPFVLTLLLSRLAFGLSATVGMLVRVKVKRLVWQKRLVLRPLLSEWAWLLTVVVLLRSCLSEIPLRF